MRSRRNEERPEFSWFSAKITVGRRGNCLLPSCKIEGPSSRTPVIVSILSFLSERCAKDRDRKELKRKDLKESRTSYLEEIPNATGLDNMVAFGEKLGVKQSTLIGRQFAKDYKEQSGHLQDGP
jgi:hypothetical protein